MWGDGSYGGSVIRGARDRVPRGAWCARITINGEDEHMTFRMSDRLALSDFGSTGEVMAEERRDKSAVLDDAMMVAARRRLLASSESRLRRELGVAA